MTLDPHICYQALLTRDGRFDGLFYVGVSSTGIYCRTVCTARTPRPEHCAFYPSAAAAERSGYRPCLRCRPELAPGLARIDSTSRLAAAAASRIEDGALTDSSVSGLAAEMGITERHLRRVIRTAFGVSPIELAQTQRLLLAKRLLTDTTLSITEVAFASGFSSLRRFNALFQERYRMTPESLRKVRPSATPQDVVNCELAFRPPFDWESLLRFLGDRATRGVEVVEEGAYLRTVALGQARGWVRVFLSPGKNTLRVQLSSSLAPVLPAVLARIKRQFDLAADPVAIAAHLGVVAAGHPGLRVPGAFDGFQVAARAILGQQISVRAATTLAGRFAVAFGEPFETPFPSLTHLHPTPERVSEASVEELASLGIVSGRARAILSLAQAIAQRKIILQSGVEIEETMGRLRQLPGIGEWTAQYIAMRALAWPDAFPHTDLGLYKAMGERNPRLVLALAETWRPWRAYAAIHLWKSLETTP